MHPNFIYIYFSNITKSKAIVYAISFKIDNISVEISNLVMNKKSPSQEFLKKKLIPLLQFVWSLTRINFIFDKLLITSSDENINFSKEKIPIKNKQKMKKILKQEKILDLIFKVIKIQRLFKIYKKRKLSIELFEIKKNKEEIENRLGTLIVKKIWKYGGKYFNLTIHKKKNRFLYFFLINNINKNEKYKTIYDIENSSELTNFTGTKLIDFLIQSLGLQGNQLVFNPIEECIAMSENSSMIEIPNFVRNFILFIFLYT